MSKRLKLEVRVYDAPDVTIKKLRYEHPSWRWKARRMKHGDWEYEGLSKDNKKVVIRVVTFLTGGRDASYDLGYTWAVMPFGIAYDEWSMRQRIREYYGKDYLV